MWHTKHIAHRRAHKLKLPLSLSGPLSVPHMDGWTDRHGSVVIGAALRPQAGDLTRLASVSNSDTGILSPSRSAWPRTAARSVNTSGGPWHEGPGPWKSRRRRLGHPSAEEGMSDTPPPHQ